MDAIVLAAAGLIRLGLGERIRSYFEVEQMLPSAGQGALGIEVRANATVLGRLLAQTLAELIDMPTWLATHAERAVSRSLGGSCIMPLAAHGQWHGDTLVLDAALGDPDTPTRPLLRARRSGRPADATAASALGQAVAAQLQADGALAYLASTAA